MSISCKHFLITVALFLSISSIAHAEALVSLEQANPLQPLPASPLGIPGKLSELPDAPTPQTVRLGRWLFFETKLSADSTLSCASCHKPEFGFSEPTPHSTGIGGQEGGRKAPPVLNLAWNPSPKLFWDGRANSMEEQASGPMLNPIEMGHPNIEAVLGRLQKTAGYPWFFKQAFGDEKITIERVTKAIADYERTRMSGNSPWDQWRANPDAGDRELLAPPEVSEYDAPPPPPPEVAKATTAAKNPFKDGPIVSAKVKWGHALFFGKAACNQCHLGPTFTDGKFHNLGVGYDSVKKIFKDPGRVTQSKIEADRGAFKTPTLREVSRRAPFMHDGSIKTLREIVELYNRGGEKNPSLSPLIKPLNLSPEEIDAIVAMLEALNGQGYMDKGPESFPE